MSDKRDSPEYREYVETMKYLDDLGEEEAKKQIMSGAIGTSRMHWYMEWLGAKDRERTLAEVRRQATAAYRANWIAGAALVVALAAFAVSLLSNSN